MLKFKLDILLPLTLYFSTITFAVKAEPIIYTGNKGQYTINDSFIASKNQSSNSKIKHELITSDSIGLARLGMTIGELKAKLGNDFKYKIVDEADDKEFMDCYNPDRRAIAVIQAQKIQFYIIYNLSVEKLQDRNKIDELCTNNIKYQTKEGVGPGTSMVVAQKIFGKATLKYGHEAEYDQRAYFSKLPKSYKYLYFRAKVKSGWKAGIYEKDKSTEYPIFKSIIIKPNAYISSISIKKVKF